VTYFSLSRAGFNETFSIKQCTIRKDTDHVFCTFPTPIHKEKTLNPNNIENFDTLAHDAAKDRAVLLGKYRNREGIAYGDVYAAHTLTRPLAAHVLVEGPTGSGKSVLVNNYLRTAEQFPDKFSATYISHRDSYSSNYPATSFSEAVDLLEEIDKEFIERQDILEQAGFRNMSELEASDYPTIPPRHIVVVDDLLHLLRDAEHGDRGNSVVRIAETITRVGRSLGVHLVATTQSERELSRIFETDMLFPVIRFRADGVRMEKSGEAMWDMIGQKSDVFSVFSDL